MVFTGRDGAPAVMDRFTDEIRSDIDEIDNEISETEKLMKALREQNQSEKAARRAQRQTMLHEVRGTLASRRLIDYSATRVVLPTRRYGSRPVCGYSPARF